MLKTIVKQETKDELTGKSCQLNGQPAKIVGRLLQFPQVSPLNPAMSAVEFTWETVKRIMARDGKFKS